MGNTDSLRPADRTGRTKLTDSPGMNMNPVWSPDGSMIAFTSDRELDESVLPYFEQTETGLDPLLGKAVGLDREQFAPVLDEFYALHGWDGNGQPTKEHLEELGLGDVYEPMAKGAERAQESAKQAT